MFTSFTGWIGLRVAAHDPGILGWRWKSRPHSSDSTEPFCSPERSAEVSPRKNSNAHSNKRTSRNGTATAEGITQQFQSWSIDDLSTINCNTLQPSNINCYQSNRHSHFYSCGFSKRVYSCFWTRSCSEFTRPSQEYCAWWMTIEVRPCICLFCLSVLHRVPGLWKSPTRRTHGQQSRRSWPARRRMLLPFTRQENAASAEWAWGPLCENSRCPLWRTHQPTGA